MKNTYKTTKTINLAPESKTIRKFLDEKIEGRIHTAYRLKKLHNLDLNEALNLFDDLHSSYEELWEMGFKRKVEVEVDMDNDYKETRVNGYPAVTWRSIHGYGQTDFDLENKEQA